MNKEETIAHFTESVFLTLKCEMCGRRRESWVGGTEVAVELAWKEGWRVQDWQLDGQTGEGAVLCQYCKDGQR